MALLQLVSGPLVLVVDRPLIHERRVIEEFIAGQERLHVSYVPVAVPALNPLS